MLVRGRYKNTKDLWLYLSERRKYYILFFESRGYTALDFLELSPPTFYSWLFSSSFEGMQTSILVGNNARPQESPQNKRRSCQENSSLATTCHQVDISIGCRTVPRYPLLLART